jgi:hypothetical protein
MTHFKYQIESIEPLCVLGSAGEKKFLGPVAKHSSKVYVVSSGKRIIYVGSSKQPIRSRLYGAIKATGQNGYSGYPWKKSKEALNLDVWILPDVAVVKGKRCLTAETVEAEIVFLIRLKDGNWPPHQTEIHFHSSNAKHRKWALEIYKEIQKRVERTQLQIHNRRVAVEREGAGALDQNRNWI